MSQQILYNSVDDRLLDTLSRAQHNTLTNCSEEIVRQLTSFYLRLVLRGQLVYRRRDILLVHRELESILDATRRQSRSLRIILRLRKDSDDLDLNMIVRDGLLLAVFLTRHDNPLEVLAYGPEALSKAVNAETRGIAVYEIPPKLVEQIPVCTPKTKKPRKRRLPWL